MKRKGLNLAFALLTFSIGASTSILHGLLVADTPKALLASQQGWFEPLKTIGGLDACGADGNYHTRELSDGTRMLNSCERLSSPAAANRALQNKLATATEIIERGPNLNDKGRVVGERVVAKTTGVIEVHTFDSYFCSTEAASLKHLQWYEHH